MSINRDTAVIRQIIKTLWEIVAKTGENELINAVAREAQLLIKRGELFLANSNPHVTNRAELKNWANDCAELTDYMNATIATRH